MPASPSKPFRTIADNAALAAWWAGVQPAAVLAVDTEFERQRTYYPELCLVQLAVGDDIVCYDPLAGGVDQLAAIMAAPAATVVMHAPRQDLEVFEVAGAPFSGVLHDTQIAAALVGHGEQVGYAELVESELGTTLEKSQTRTDWRRRPLSAAQLDYAADDVRHLAELHERLRARLAELQRTAWFEEDCAALTAEPLEAPVERAWQRVKGLAGLPEAAFRRGVALAAWREQTARERNLPRGWVVKDRALVAAALADPRDQRALAAALADDAAAARRHGRAMLDAMADADTLATPARSDPPGPAERARVKRLAARVQALAGELGIVPSVLLTRREMERIVRGDLPSRVQSGWRAPLLQEAIAALAAESPDG